MSNEIQQLAKTELDRIWAIMTEASRVHEESKGKMNEAKAFEIAKNYFHFYETTKSAYRAIGLIGSIGIHRI